MVTQRRQAKNEHLVDLNYMYLAISGVKILYSKDATNFYFHTYTRSSNWLRNNYRMQLMIIFRLLAILMLNNE